MPLTFEEIQKLCNNFMNESDTIIGMENNWTDMMIDKMDLDASKEDIMQALKVSTCERVISVPVKFVYDGEEEDTNVYVAIHDGYIMVSTQERLL
jgi:hypothetical protein